MVGAYLVRMIEGFSRHPLPGWRSAGGRVWECQEPVRSTEVDVARQVHAKQQGHSQLFQAGWSLHVEESVEGKSQAAPAASLSNLKTSMRVVPFRGDGHRFRCSHDGRDEPRIFKQLKKRTSLLNHTIPTFPNDRNHHRKKTLRARNQIHPTTNGPPPPYFVASPPSARYLPTQSSRTNTIMATPSERA